MMPLFILYLLLTPVVHVGAAASTIKLEYNLEQPDAVLYSFSCIVASLEAFYDSIHQSDSKKLDSYDAHVAFQRVWGEDIPLCGTILGDGLATVGSFSSIPLRPEGSTTPPVLYIKSLSCCRVNFKNLGVPTQPIICAGLGCFKDTSRCVIKLKVVKGETLLQEFPNYNACGLCVQKNCFSGVCKNGEVRFRMIFDLYFQTLDMFNNLTSIWSTTSLLMGIWQWTLFHILPPTMQAVLLVLLVLGTHVN
jgi:hypothetical protein